MILGGGEVVRGHEEKAGGEGTTGRGSAEARFITASRSSPTRACTLVRLSRRRHTSVVCAYIGCVLRERLCTHAMNRSMRPLRATANVQRRGRERGARKCGSVWAAGGWFIGRGRSPTPAVTRPLDHQPRPAATHASMDDGTSSASAPRDEDNETSPLCASSLARPPTSWNAPRQLCFPP